MKKILLLFLLSFFCLGGCVRQKCEQPLSSKYIYPEIINPSLIENIKTYANERVASFRELGNENWRDGNIISLKYFQQSDTTIYLISQTCIGHMTDLGTPPLLMTKIDDIYIALSASKEENTDIKVSIKTIVDFMSEDYPEYISEYKEYLKRLETNPDDEDYALWAFTESIYEGDYWILKYINGKLVSKTVISGIHGFQEYIEY